MVGWGACGVRGWERERCFWGDERGGKGLRGWVELALVLFCLPGWCCCGLDDATKSRSVFRLLAAWLRCESNDV